MGRLLLQHYTTSGAQLRRKQRHVEQAAAAKKGREFVDAVTVKDIMSMMIVNTFTHGK